MIVDAIRKTQKKYGSRALTTAVVAGVVLVLAGYSPVAKGLVLGTLFSVLNFVLMGQILPMLFSPSQRRSVLMSFGAIIGRYVLLSIPLIVSIKLANFNFFAAALGIIMVQVMIMVEYLIQWIHPQDMQRT